MSAVRLTASILTAAVGAAVGVTGLATASSAAPDPGRAAAADSCLLRVQKVRVKDLQHDQSGTDQVFARIGNSRTTTRPYSLPQTRNTLLDGRELFTSTAQITLKVDFAGHFIPVGSAIVECHDANPSFVFDNNDARYKVKALVQVQP